MLCGRPAQAPPGRYSSPQRWISFLHPPNLATPLHRVHRSVLKAQSAQHPRTLSNGHPYCAHACQPVHNPPREATLQSIDRYPPCYARSSCSLHGAIPPSRPPTRPLRSSVARSGPIPGSQARFIIREMHRVHRSARSCWHLVLCRPLLCRPFDFRILPRDPFVNMTYWMRNACNRETEKAQR